MKHIKLLYVAILGVCYGEIHGAALQPVVLDFDTIAADGANIPSSFQPKWNGNIPEGINAPNGQYIYFTVVPNEGGAAGNVNFASLNINALAHAAAQQAPIVGDINIYFPLDGHQPTTLDAARWSCANVGAYDLNHPITDWYVRAFGGDTGVELSYGRPVPAKDSAPQIGFSNAMNSSHHIITVNITTSGTTADFAKNFWQTFREIAANPVGRVLLYRILIEIRRRDATTHNGVCGDGITPGSSTLTKRNSCRSIIVEYSNSGCSFTGGSKKTLKFDPNDVKAITVKLGNLNRCTTRLETDDDPNDDTSDIGIFHEMLHWFHFLRNPVRYKKSDSADPKHYKYLLRCYYGDHHEISEICTWDGFVNDEEIRTILGTPNYNTPGEFALIDYVGTFLPNNSPGNININDGVQMRHVPLEARFLEGDDLSENVYRMSKTIPGGGDARYKMRFGHGETINPIIIRNGQIPNRFKLAHLVATTCYRNVTGVQPQNWRLVHSQAAQ